jgi:membrane associated rhomboid family serine protease
MDATGIICTGLIVANIIISNKGFSDHRFYDRYSFNVDRILIGKDYKRLITSGFLHVSWTHLFFNMISLYAFTAGFSHLTNGIEYLIIYTGSLLGGNLFSLFIHKNHGDYSSVGASGAISGIIFSSIVIFPGIQIGFFGLPLYLPGWLYGLAYILFSIYAIRSKSDNIGHEAHLGGGLAGVVIAIILHPSSIINNYFTILVIVIPSVVFLYYIIKKPAFLLIDNFFYKSHHNFNVEDKYNITKINKEQEIDRILEKIHKKGVKSLTRQEKEKLDSFSKGS